MSTGNPLQPRSTLSDPTSQFTGSPLRPGITQWTYNWDTTAVGWGRGYSTLQVQRCDSLPSRSLTAIGVGS
jgi:hypothetical protein